MAKAASPVEKRFELLAQLWLEVAEASDLRAVVWRIPANADAMLGAFFEAHKHADPALTPDCFVVFDTALETGFGYSRGLLDAMWDGYLNSRETLLEDNVPVTWRGVHESYPTSASGVIRMFESFADYYHEQMRYFVPVFKPSQLNSVEAFDTWVEHALLAVKSPRLKIALVDNEEKPHWDALVAKYPGHVRVINAPIDMFDVARETAAQAGGSGPAVAYRQMFTDVLSATEKGTAAQAASRADRAMALAQRQGWPEQQAALNMTVAGAHLKEKDVPRAVTRYRAARVNAEEARAAGSPAGGTLVVQTWFGEAGAWFVADQLPRAAEAYAEGAKAARQVPHAMFALEGERMAGFCLARVHQDARAQQHYLRGIGDARDMSPGDRPLTTLPLLLQDMLRLQDAARTAKLESASTEYEQAIAKAAKDAERDAGKLGQSPDPDALARIEAVLTASYEDAFNTVRKKREAVIAGGDDMFRKIVAIGRDYVHPAWNGVPDIKHPLDTEQPAWDALPEYAKLPDPSDLLANEEAMPEEAVAMEKTA